MISSTFKKSLLGFSLLLISVCSFSQDREYGVIDAINIEKATMVINDQFFRLSLTLGVTTRDGNSGNRHSLRKGDKVLYLSSRVNNRNVLEEIWQLDNNYQHQDSDDD